MKPLRPTFQLIATSVLEQLYAEVSYIQMQIWQSEIYAPAPVRTSGLFAADTDLDAAIARNRMGTLVIRAAPGARVTVEQIRHEFWFGATLPNGIFNGRASADDAAKFKEVFYQPLQRRGARVRFQVARDGGG